MFLSLADKIEAETHKYTEEEFDNALKVLNGDN